MALRTTFPLDDQEYGFEWLRAMLESALAEGVVGSGDYKVTAAAAGGMRVDVASGTALVKGDTGTPGTGLSQGLYVQVNDASIANAVTLDAAHASLPRIDQIVLTVNDSSDLGSAGDVATLAKVTGTATSGATLDNRNGHGSLPNNSLLLADVLVPAASSSVSVGNIRDRRPWARGAEGSAFYTSGMGVVTNSVVMVPGTQVRVEVGVGQQLKVDGWFLLDPGQNQFWQGHIFDNGSQVGPTVTVSRGADPGSPPVGYGGLPGMASYTITTAGSHLIDVRANNSAATGGLTNAALFYRVTNAPAGSNT